MVFRRVNFSNLVSFVEKKQNLFGQKVGDKVHNMDNAHYIKTTLAKKTSYLILITKTTAFVNNKSRTDTICL